MMEKTKIKMTLEVSFPNPEGGIPQKYSVSRALKAGWYEDPKKISSEILEEIKTYKGSFMGDLSLALTSLVKTKGRLIEGSTEDLDALKWCSETLESLIFLGIKDNLHLDSLDRQEVSDWDGSTRNIGKLTAERIKEVDIEKLLLLLAPRIKHSLFLISKDVDRKESDEEN